MSFEQLSDQLLVEAYKKALSLNLSEDFLALLKEEIDRRGIKLED